jgi:hypothetical protein
VSEQGREEASVCVLKPREVLHGRTGAGDAGGTRGGSGGGGVTWSGRGKPMQGRGSGGADAGATHGARQGGTGATQRRSRGAEGWR